ncbi:MAG: AAA family ATPase, partial [Cryomorphaceae bacterium]|nr:AAA family ATPase [Cryomorphaceae bacterium]
MKKIEFKKVGMQNFCNYIDPMELEFENGKLVTITGPNGVGKSNIFQALPFTLFGVTSEGAKGDDVTNNEVEKNCHTWTEFSIDDDDYRVDRFHKYTRKGNSVELRKNGEEPYKVGQRETLPEIEKLLLPRKLFMNTLLFSQGIKDFFTDLTDTEKKDIFRKILQLDNYVMWHDQVKRKIKDIGERILKLNQTLDLKNEMTIDVLKQIDILKKAEEEFNKNRDNVIKSIKDEILNLIDQRDKLIQEFDSYKEFPEKIKEVNNKIINQTQKISDLELKEKNTIEIINNKMLLKKNELTTSFEKEEFVIKDSMYKKRVMIENGFTSKIQEEIDKSVQKINNLNIKFTSLQSEIKSTEERISEIQENVIDKDISTCPTCYQEIGEKEKQELKDKVVLYSDSIRNKIEDTFKIKEEINNLTKEKDNNITILKERKIKNLNEIGIKEGSELLELGKRLENLLIKLKEKSKEIINENTKSGLIEKQKLESELEKLKIEYKELQVIDEKIRQLEVSIPTITTKLDMVEKNLKQKELEKFNDEILVLHITKLKNLKDEIKNVKSIRIDIAKDLEILEFWKIGYSQNGIPAMLIDESIPFLNNRVAYYLDKIANGRYTVSFDTMSTTKSGEFRDKISVNVIDNQTKANSRVQLSGGQRQAVAVARAIYW